MSGATRQRSIVLILARDLASTLATPMVLVDNQGDILFFNEAASRISGRPFVEGKTMPLDEWRSMFQPSDEEGLPVPFEEMPLGIALRERRPAHRVITIQGPDGVAHRLQATAIPLFARADELVGGLAVFWGDPGEA